jgi:hypothetical protein
VAAFGYLNTALVWVFAHQLGYCWRDGSLRPARRRWALALGGLCALVVITSLGVYPRSLVALQGQERSHMFPTTAGVAALAVFQTGVATLLAPAIARRLRRRGPWMAVIAINSVILTVFLWHMTALLALERAGLEPLPGRTAAWWLQRPLWLVVPGIVLAVLVAVFARFELPRRRTHPAGSR